MYSIKALLQATESNISLQKSNIFSIKGYDIERLNNQESIALLSGMQMDGL